MNKFLLNILKDANTIIIPGLGAMTLTNKATGEVMFMPYLKHDDGNLSKFISEKEGIEESAAKEIIKKFIGEVELKLSNGENFVLEGLGTFFKDSSGDIDFEAWKMEEASLVEKVLPTSLSNDNEEAVHDYEEPTTHLEETSLVEIVEEEPLSEKVIQEEVSTIEIVEEEPIADEAIQKDAPVIEIPEEKEESSIIEEFEQVDEPVKTPEFIIKDSEELVEKHSIESPVDELEKEPSTPIEKIVYSENDQWEDDLDLPPITVKIERPKKPVLEKVKKDKKRRGPLFYALLVFGVLLVGGGATVGLFYNQVKAFIVSMGSESEDATKLADKQFEFSEEAEPDEEPVNEESIDEQVPLQETEVNSVEEQPIVEEQPMTPSTVDVNQGFHLITGSFQNKDFAERFSAKMTAEGNSASVIGPNNGFYLISIGSFSSEVEAKKELQNKKGTYPNVWIYKKN